MPQLRQSIDLIVGETVYDCHVLALDIAGVFEALAKCTQAVRDHVRRPAVEKSDHRHGRLLRSRRERPSSRRAAEQRDEVASSHSITSSASESKLSEIVTPSDLAVLRLITNSNFVD